MEQVLLLGQDNPTVRLQAELYDILAVSEVRSQGGPRSAITFSGRLLRDAESALATLMSRFHAHGYTPLIRRNGKQDVVVAVKGVFAPGRSRPWINLLLLVATIFTTTLAGALLQGVNLLRNPLDLVAGLPFALTLLLILGTHELGHYFMGRWHGVQVSLPYFIPVPLGLGTFGAFIQMKSPVRNRQALFDVGFAGPIAGFVVALPLLVFGLLLSDVVPASRTGMDLGSSLVVGFLSDLLRPHGPGSAVALHPVAVAAYFGILITGFNLLPAGQLDGGHVAYAVLGSAARPVAVLTLIAMVIMGAMLWSGWYIWALLVLFTGLRHAAPLNDVTPLDMPRRLIGLGAILLFVLTFIPKPF
jgi:membrane-associated protease RseP (regulator of RpoE activity)